MANNRNCLHCFYSRPSFSPQPNKYFVNCQRYPQSLIKRNEDWCGEWIWLDEVEEETDQPR